MKYLYWLMAILTLMYVLPVITKYSSGDTINAASVKSADKSAMLVTKYLSADERVVFNTAYGLIKEIKVQESGEDAFLSAVKGLNPQGVVSLARQEFNAHVAKGDARFTAYRDWDDMIAKTTKLKESPKKPSGS